MAVAAVANHALGSGEILPWDAARLAITSPDYDRSDIEEDEDYQLLGTSISCISLGSWCGVAQCLQVMNLRDAAYPFDWNRTSIQGLIHFISNEFEDFFNFFLVKDAPGLQQKAYCGKHHSVWHEDLATPAGYAKYHRRIRRFYDIAAERLLFVRAVNDSEEVENGHVLLQVLQTCFPSSEVFLLLTIDCQPETRSFIVGGRSGHLMAQCNHYTRWLGSPLHCKGVLVHQEGISFALRRAASSELPMDPSLTVLDNIQQLQALIAPFNGGPPQLQPYTPRPVGMPAPEFPGFPPDAQNCSPPVPMVDQSGAHGYSEQMAE
mmetsp:Transcript_29201/g.67925  ORF Transcript_29201/g.67925 Transcript_29201/m.67925 type:complete len:320 (+) Transcript_29201:117-1076(+)|eukprot:CAMPEP_0178424546 /NCGR_PEP_ID=MMETSP0689_2-20121128/28265_1 /TAXON_ID=160604 /ORGANISM="Amphidinium massartii, Strain CS-259" /LENGTH=319 /DNA_ID=CAMNT_0020046185 /DNA_START=10 /DNA_END=969 /DNA_ORIENTATION=+